MNTDDPAAINDADAITASDAARLLQRRQRRRPPRRPPEDLRVKVGVDIRTRAGRAARELKAALLAHLGPRPSVPALALVEQLLQLKLRLVTMDERFLLSGGALTMHDTRQYLAWSNSYSRSLRTLGFLTRRPSAPRASPKRSPPAVRRP